MVGGHIVAFIREWVIDARLLLRTPPEPQTPWVKSVSDQVDLGVNEEWGLCKPTGYRKRNPQYFPRSLIESSIRHRIKSNGRLIRIYAKEAPDPLLLDYSCRLGRWEEKF